MIDSYGKLWSDLRRVTEVDERMKELKKKKGTKERKKRRY